MKRRNKKLAAFSLSLALGTGAFATVLQAETLTKTLKATYNNIKVTFNNQYKQPAQEPFMVDGTVYVSLRDAGQMTGNNVEWDGTNKTVKISQGAGSVSSTELANKNAEIAALKTEVTQLKEKLAKYEKVEGVTPDGNLSTSEIKKTLEYLADDYSSKYSIDWEFALEESKGNLNLELSFGRRDSSDFNSLSEKNLDSYLSSVCKLIQKYHPKIQINGSIYDGKEEDTVMKFTYSTSGKLSIDAGTTQYALNRFADELEDDYPQLDKINHGKLAEKTYRTRAFELTYDKRNDEIVFLISVDMEEIDDWNSLVELIGNKTSGPDYSKTNMYLLEELLMDISDDIYDYFDVSEVSGMIYNTINGDSSKPSSGSMIVKFDDEKLSLRNFPK